jgi:hypothetical protein
MFESINNNKDDKPVLTPPESVEKNMKYKNLFNTTTITNEDNYNKVEELLEMEKQHNKTETWNKLDKTIKTRLLHQYAEKYGKEHNIPVKDVKSLKQFFITCLEKNKLQKTKDLVYDKDVREIISIPALHFNQINRSFTLKNIDTKRVSTLKSLTPKRITEKNMQDSQETHTI